MEGAGGGQGLAGGGGGFLERREQGRGRHTKRRDQGKGFTPRVSHPYSKPSQLLKENKLYFTEFYIKIQERGPLYRLPRGT